MRAFFGVYISAWRALGIGKLTPELSWLKLLSGATSFSLFLFSSGVSCHQDAVKFINLFMEAINSMSVSHPGPVALAPKEGLRMHHTQPSGNIRSRISLYLYFSVLKANNASSWERNGSRKPPGGALLHVFLAGNICWVSQGIRRSVQVEMNQGAGNTHQYCTYAISRASQLEAYATPVRQLY